MPLEICLMSYETAVPFILNSKILYGGGCKSLFLSHVVVL